MKKVSLLIFLAIFVSITSIVYAKTSTYEDIGLSIDLPDTAVVVTKSMMTNRSALIALGLNNYQIDYLQTTNDLDLFALTDKYALTITKSKTSYSDFSQVNDNIVQFIFEQMKESYKDLGIKIEKSELYYNANAKYIKLHCSLNLGKDSYPSYPGIQYISNVDGYAYSISYFSISGELTAYDEKNADSIITSVQYKNTKNETQDRTPSHLYIDKKTGISFLIPENWTEGSLSRKRKVLKTCFESTEEEGTSLYFGYFDVWKKLPFYKKLGHNREEINTKFFYDCLLDISDNEWSGALASITSDLVENANLENMVLVTRNRVEYIRVEITSISDTEFGRLQIKTDSYYHIENGVLYSWQCNVFRNNPHYKEFLNLIDSISYNTSRNDMYFELFLNAILGLVLTIIVHPLPIWIYRYYIRKEAVDYDTAKRIVNIDTVVVAAFFIVLSVFWGGGLSFIALFFWRNKCIRILTDDGSKNSEYLPYSPEIKLSAVSNEINAKNQGLTREQPIYMKDHNETLTFLNSLLSSDGEKLRWLKAASVKVEGAINDVDCYISQLENQQSYKTLFICENSESSSSIIPIGFTLNKEKNSTAFDDSISSKSLANNNIKTPSIESTSSQTSDVNRTKVETKNEKNSDTSIIYNDKDEFVDNYCWNCGAKLRKNSRFCSSCGAIIKE